MLKKRILFSLFSVFVIGMLNLFLVQRCEYARTALSCDITDFDFGRIPVEEKGDFAIGKHQFLIKNNTSRLIKLKSIQTSCPCLTIDLVDDAIDANEVGRVQVTMRLPKYDLEGRSVQLIIMPFEHSPLILTVSGRSGYSVYMDNKNISFGNVFRNSFEKIEKDFWIYCADEKRLDAFVLNAKTDKEDAVSLLVEEYDPQQIIDSSGVYYFHRAKIHATLNITDIAELGPASAKVFIWTKTGSTEEVSLNWLVTQKEVFDPTSFYLIDLKVNEERSFSVIYNASVGGAIRAVKTSEVALNVENIEPNGDSIFILLKYMSKKSVKDGEVLGKLTVETEDGKVHTMPVISS